MLESFITAFIVYFVVIDPVGNAPIFLAVTQHLDRVAKTRTALECSLVAFGIMLFFALCGNWILGYLSISITAFKIAGGIILLLVSLDMLSAKRQDRKKQGSDKATASAENVAVFPLAIPLLAGPAAITSVMVVSADLSGNAAQSLIGYGALGAVMVATAVILVLTGLAQNFIDPRIASVFSRVTAIILAALSVQYIIDGLTELGLAGTAG